MSWFESVDVALFRFGNQTLSHPYLDLIVPVFSGFPLFLPVVILLAVLVFWKGGLRARLFVIVLFATLAFGEALLIAPMKAVVARPRPFLELAGTRLLSGPTGSGSMPSSHTSTWFAVAFITFLYYRRSWVFMVPLAAMVGFSRIYVGVHYPSDVLAGAILGAGYAAVCAWWLNVFWQRIGPDWFPHWWARVPSLILPNPSPGLPPPESFAPVHETTPNVERKKPLSSQEPVPVSESSAKAGDIQQATTAATLPRAAEATDLQWLRLGYLLIGILFAIQLIYLASRRIELSGDEAYQWLWSKHLALSYYSKPPLIAYLQFLGTSIWGDNAFGVRFFAPVIAAIICLLLLRFFAREVNARAGFWLVLIFHSTPLLAVGGTLMTIDPPLVLFWVAAMLAGWRAVQPNSTARHWAWVGLWMGLGFLSKYSALFLLPCWAVFFLLWPPARLQLRRAGPYLALLILALCTLPVIIWNAQHGWISFRHVAFDNAGLGNPWQPTLKFLGEFLGSEFGLLNPVFFCAMIWAAFAFWRRHRHEPLYLFFFSMGAPVFVIYLLFTGYKRVLPNWIAPSVIPLFCLMTLYFGARWTARFPNLARRLLATGIVLGAVVNIFLHDTNMLNKLIGRALPVPLDPLRRVRAWSDTAQATGQARQKLLAEGKPVFIIASQYDLAGECSFYLPEARAAVRGRPLVYCPTSSRPSNQFYFWPGYRPERRGENAIYVHELPLPKLGPGWFGKWLRGEQDFYAPLLQTGQAPPPEIVREFDSVRSLGAIGLEYRGRTLRRLELFACRNLH